MELSRAHAEVRSYRHGLRNTLPWWWRALLNAAKKSCSEKVCKTPGHDGEGHCSILQRRARVTHEKHLKKNACILHDFNFLFGHRFSIVFFKQKLVSFWRISCLQFIHWAGSPTDKAGGHAAYPLWEWVPLREWLRCESGPTMRVGSNPPTFFKFQKRCQRQCAWSVVWQLVAEMWIITCMLSLWTCHCAPPTCACKLANMYLMDTKIAGWAVHEKIAGWVVHQKIAGLAIHKKIAGSNLAQQIEIQGRQQVYTGAARRSVEKKIFDGSLLSWNTGPATGIHSGSQEICWIFFSTDLC